MENELTAKQVVKKYKGKYIDVYRRYNYNKDIYTYEVRKAYKEIHENTCLVLNENFYNDRK